jgi:hypothetical protein
MTNPLLMTLGLYAAACFASAAAAGTLAVPQGDAVLTVTGGIENTNMPGAAVFDLDMLDSLPGGTVATETPWFDDEKTFTGPLISAVLDAVNAYGDTLVVTAINDYSAEIPLSDARNFPVIFATRIDGELMPVREKGPIFVVYPFDQAPELYNEQYFGRSVWQVKFLEIR